MRMPNWKFWRPLIFLCIIGTIPAGANAKPDVARAQELGSATVVAASSFSTDDVQLKNYPNNMGFEITAGGCSVLYVSKTKTMTLIQEDGTVQQVTFSN